MHRPRWKPDGLCNSQKFIYSVAVEGNDKDCMRLGQPRIKKDFTNQAHQLEAVSTRFQHDGCELRSDFCQRRASKISQLKPSLVPYKHSQPTWQRSEVQLWLVRWWLHNLYGPETGSDSLVLALILHTLHWAMEWKWQKVLSRLLSRDERHEWLLGSFRSPRARRNKRRDSSATTKAVTKEVKALTRNSLLIILKSSSIHLVHQYYRENIYCNQILFIEE